MRAWRAACVCWRRTEWRAAGCVVCVGGWVAVSFVIVSFAGDGRVFTWGSNFGGRLGLGDTNKRPMPTAVSLPDDEAVEELHCGSYYFFARVGMYVCVCMYVARVTCVRWVSIWCVVCVGRQLPWSAGSGRHDPSHCPHPRGERVLTRGGVAVVWR